MRCVTEFVQIKITESQYTDYLKISHVIARFLPRISDCDLLFWLLKGKFLKQLYNYTTAGFFFLVYYLYLLLFFNTVT